jgi:hypothetical protein
VEAGPTLGGKVTVKAGLASVEVGGSAKFSTRVDQRGFGASTKATKTDIGVGLQVGPVSGSLKVAAETVTQQDGKAVTNPKQEDKSGFEVGIGTGKGKGVPGGEIGSAQGGLKGGNTSGDVVVFGGEITLGMGAFAELGVSIDAVKGVLKETIPALQEVVSKDAQGCVITGTCHPK